MVQDALSLKREILSLIPLSGPERKGHEKIDFSSYPRKLLLTLSDPRRSPYFITG
jgi:hypothetical protein